MKESIVIIPNIVIKEVTIDGYYPGKVYHLYVNGRLENTYMDKSDLLGRVFMMINNEVNTLDLMDIDFPNSRKGV